MNEKTDSIYELDWPILESISYRTKLGKSLKNTLRKFEKEALFEELNAMIVHFTQSLNDQILPQDNRIKSLHSCFIKYEKYFPSTEVEKVFNDILGLRIIISDYKEFDSITFPQQARIADMRNGKVFDDGYRGIHVYYQKDHFHYPIEIQYMTKKDRQFNEWLHIYLYKYTDNKEIGIELRDMYEKGFLVSEEQFREEMEKHVLFSSKEI